MKRLLAIVLLAAAIVTGPALASSPLLGSWAVEVSQLPMPPEQRPKSVTFTFAASGDNELTIDVSIVTPDGTEMRSAAVASLDGKPVPVKNSIEADVAAAKQPSPDVLVLVLSKGGVAGSTRVYAVQPGGTTMVETATYFGADGQPIMRTNQFSKIQ